jgi:hypothetical protein
MKNVIALVVVLSLGLFCAVGCNKPAAKKEPPKTPAAGKDMPKADATMPEPKADAPAADAPKDEPKADAPKPEEEKK